MDHYKYIIIGAGLSGLTSAYYLNMLGETDVFVLESRDRLGGRICTENGIDLGATWFQNHHTRVAALLKQLELDHTDQYAAGKSILVYNKNLPTRHFQNDPNAPAAKRIAGYSHSLIDKLAQPIANRIKTSVIVNEIVDKENHLEIITNNKTYTANKVIVTLPPHLASQLVYAPSLPQDLRDTMQKIETWMEHSIKVGLTYKRAFWKENDFSGTILGQSGAVTELYDHSDSTTGTFALMGFVNEELRHVSTQERKDLIVEYIATHLGEKARAYIHYEEKDWSLDPYTSFPSSIYRTRNYGNPIFQNLYFNNKLIFSGTETSPINGAYMDGAIYSGINAVKKLKEI